jgi:hypothetical protein
MQTRFQFRIAIFTLLILGSVSFFHPSIHAANYTLEDGYTQPDAISDEVWNTMSPHFLSEDSEEKAILDSIFMESNLLLSRSSLISGNFQILTKAKHKIAVMRHPLLPGYVLKAYLENSDADEALWWVKRIRGADAIREKIVEYGYEDILKCPKKKVYPLPHYPDSERGDYPKHFILIAEDMDVLAYEENKKAYVKWMNEELLDAFYTIITEMKLQEAVFIFNAPFSKDGRIAFIDTELYLADTTKMPYEQLNNFLSSKMKWHWIWLTSQP